ncbi:class I SAM-dependent methyltransferase [Candidatus Sodalis endolongispinus]|uniref:Class I SAM-dependent methyltransferase n=1 Tax=Candidatus Sodalis endolongispinus TaxID=2812662 RepID=A0ABS5Y9W0_9GAMM|nr:class I SAM-dependent methyltransferase [Candidatus Sodalis endolongispinus]MBT9431795.1 class I SAM-dependent methyltransferase [Candidatus Sodalis endolongispinus]
MAIDFHASSNQYTYAKRVAHAGWGDFICQRVDPAGKAIADICCGCGIYSAVWAGLGARQVTGVDFSAQMLHDAQETVQGLTNVAFVQGDAAATGLADASQDIVFARALIHHFASPHPFLLEAWRILSPGGLLLIQDRTPEDVFLPGSPEHMRGWFFDLFPQLAAYERERRPASGAIEAALTATGFELRPTTTLWETRREYADSAALAADLRRRTWRSILHELSDEALAQLIAYILARLPAGQPIVENDRWTLWWALKPNVAGTTATEPAPAQ